MPFVVRMGDSRVKAWFGVLGRLATDKVLARLLKDRCIRGIIPFEQKIFLLLSRPADILSMQRKVPAIASDTEEVDVLTIADHSTPVEK